MKILTWIFLITFSTICNAKDYFTDAQIASIKKQLNTSSIRDNIPLQTKKGVLSDGFEYVSVGFNTNKDLENTEKLRIETEDTTLYTSRCAVFKTTSGGKLELLGKSALITNGGYKSSINCVIQRKSVVISTDGWSGGGGSSRAYKFSKIGSELILVGVDDYLYQFSGDNVFEKISSYNLLSGQGVHSVKKGENVKEYEENDFPVFPFRVIKPYKYKEKKFTFKPYPKATFSSFNPDKVYEWIKNQENACGYFNEEFKFESCKELEAKFK